MQTSYTQVMAHTATVLASSSTAAALVHCEAERLNSNVTSVTLWRSPFRPGFGVLLTGDVESSLEVLGGYRREATCIGVRIRDLSDECVALATSIGRYICAVPIEPSEDAGRIVFGRERIGSWETFKLVAHAGYQPSAFEARLISWTEQLLAGSLTAWAAYQILRPTWVEAAGRQFSGVERTFARDTAGLLLAYLPSSEWQILAQLILEDWVAVGTGLRYIFQDPWIDLGLVKLVRRAVLEQRKFQNIGSDLDSIQRSGYGGSFASFGHALTVSARKSAASAKRACVLATARNEGLYLVEWVAYHKALGFEQIFIYSNNNEDGSDALLQSLANAGEIIWINNDVATGTIAQEKAYAHAFSMLPELLDYQWTLVIDLDEFLVLDVVRFPSVREYLDWQEGLGADAVGLNWVIFGSSGRYDWENLPLIARFKQPSESVSRTIKTLCRTNLFFHAQPHFPITNQPDLLRFHDANGELHHYVPTSEATAATRECSSKTAWIAHYAYKSLDEFLWKSTRNIGNEPLIAAGAIRSLSDRAARAFSGQFWDRSQPEEDRPLTNLIPMNLEIQRLLRHPAVSIANTAVQSRYISMIKQIRQDFHGDMQALGLDSR